MHSAESAEVLMLCFYWVYQDHTWFTAQQNWLTTVPVTFCVLLYIFFLWANLYCRHFNPVLFSKQTGKVPVQCDSAPFPHQLLFPEIQHRVRVLQALSCEITGCGLWTALVQQI